MGNKRVRMIKTHEPDSLREHRLKGLPDKVAERHTPDKRQTVIKRGVHQSRNAARNQRQWRADVYDNQVG